MSGFYLFVSLLFLLLIVVCIDLFISFWCGSYNLLANPSYLHAWIYFCFSVVGNRKDPGLNIDINALGK